MTALSGHPQDRPLTQKDGHTTDMTGSSSSLPGFHPAMPAVTSIEDAVTEALRNGIIRSDLPPGQRLVQEQLAERFGVSRIPLRDALRRLEAEGLVRIDPRKGTAYVAELSLKDVEEIYELGIMVEATCMRYAIQSLDDAAAERILALSEGLDETPTGQETIHAHRRAFYATLYGYSGKPRMTDLLLRLWDDVFRYHVITHVSEGRHAHSELRECIRRRDADGAVRIVTQHRREVSRALIKALSGEDAAPSVRAQ